MKEQGLYKIKFSPNVRLLQTDSTAYPISFETVSPEEVSATVQTSRRALNAKKQTRAHSLRVMMYLLSSELLFRKP